ncbi:MAG: hypothetical protein ACERKV_01680 [Clostridiaceae bacterium]
MKRKNIFWGVLFVLAGIVLVVSKLGFFPGVNALSMILTVFLVIVIVKSIFHLNFIGILFPLAFICIIYDKQLGITAITPWTVLFAALLGSIGLSMIFHKHIKWGNTKFNNEDYKFEKIDVEDEGNIAFKNSFGACIKYVNTDKFEQAQFDCSFGAMKVYFDNANMIKDNAVVKIDASFSGVELYIPKTWNVEDKTTVFLGGVSEKNRSNQETINKLTLVGNISFSGVEIIYI